MFICTGIYVYATGLEMSVVIVIANICPLFFFFIFYKWLHAIEFAFILKSYVTDCGR